MISQRQLFLNYQAQTSPTPLFLEIIKAEHIWLFDKDGKKYMDLISGIAVSNLGHRHPEVVDAVKKQVDQYMHLMVYGEMVQTPQVELARLLADNLPNELNCTYFVNSGSEAVEGALKLAKRFTGRTSIVACKNAYHGSTHGALSVMGNEYFKNAFRPLLPDIHFIKYNNIQDLDFISKNTAAVIIESIQGEAGAIVPDAGYMKLLREKCNATETLLIVDEIQTGFGRTGPLFAFSNYGIVPDIITLGKGMGGGMPIGAFISSKEIMACLTHNPVLGHITTFGGHPVSCAAGLATLKTLLEGQLMDQVQAKEKLFKKLLVHPKIKNIRGKGLLLALEFESKESNFQIIQKCLQNGLLTDWFLFCDYCLRLAPPLTINEAEIHKACELILKSIEEVR